MGVYNFAVIKGDGIGPDIVDEEIKILNRVAEKIGHSFNYKEVLLGGAAIDAVGEPCSFLIHCRCRLFLQNLCYFFFRFDFDFFQSRVCR